VRTLEEERRLRIRVSVAAYAYEYCDDPIMGDAEYDRLSEQIDVTIPTGNKKLDRFFVDHYESCTGMWVRKHPDTDGLAKIYNTVWKDKERN
jgi:hypothetical protein